MFLQRNIANSYVAIGILKKKFACVSFRSKYATYAKTKAICQMKVVSCFRGLKQICKEFSVESLTCVDLNPRAPRKPAGGKIGVNPLKIIV